jgi:hypothetical protein
MVDPAPGDKVKCPRRRRGLGVGPAGGLLTEMDAFFSEHERCGDLDAGVEGAVVWIACDCGASMARRVDEGDALAFND